MIGLRQDFGEFSSAHVFADHASLSEFVVVSASGPMLKPLKTAAGRFFCTFQRQRRRSIVASFFNGHYEGMASGGMPMV